jgi:glycosyltransferase involved in cell wall biosynthesis
MSAVDIIVPCYKYAHYLRGCVESALAQPGVDVRVLILDDASPDHAPEVAEELCRQYPRVAYRRHPVNRGHIDTYNEGLEWAASPYALLLSADDMLAPGALARAVRVMERHPEVSLTHGDQVVFEAEPGLPRTPAEATDCPYEVIASEAFIEDCCGQGGNPVATPTAVFRTATQKDVGGYRKSLPHTADLENWLRIAARAAVARLRAHQAYKRMHAGNMQHQYVGPAPGHLEQMAAAFEAFFEGAGRRLANANQLRGRALRRLAEEAFWSANWAFDRGDDAACGRLLDYALRLSPAVRAQPAWSRLRWKRRLGVRLWGVLGPLANRLRRNQAVDPRSPAEVPLSATS